MLIYIHIFEFVLVPRFSGVNTYFIKNRSSVLCWKHCEEYT